MIIFASADAATTEAVSTEAVWIGGIAVVVAALVTVVGVYFQTRKTLRAEEIRLTLQLGHDRATRERAELRGVIDAASTEMDEMAFVAIQCLTAAEKALAATKITGRRRKVAKRVSKSSEDLEDMLEELFARIRRVDNHISKLKARLGTDAPAVQAYQLSRQHFGVLHTRMIDLEIEDKAEIEQVFNNAGAAKRRFESLSFELIKSQLD